MLPHDLARIEDPVACDLILNNAASLEPESLSLVRLALEEPLTLLDRFVSLLAAYWESAFQMEWQRLEELLASNVAEAGAHIATHGIYAFLQGLWPEIRTDQAASINGDHLVIMASNGGAATNPDWYHNVLANPIVTVELGIERFQAHATIAKGQERERLYAHHAALMPGFAGYQQKTTRQIPVVVLERVG